MTCFRSCFALLLVGLAGCGLDLGTALPVTSPLVAGTFAGDVTTNTRFRESFFDTDVTDANTTLFAVVINEDGWPLSAEDVPLAQGRVVSNDNGGLVYEATTTSLTATANSLTDNYIARLEFESDSGSVVLTGQGQDVYRRRPDGAIELSIALSVAAADNSVIIESLSSGVLAPQE